MAVTLTLLSINAFKGYNALENSVGNENSAFYNVMGECKHYPKCLYKV